jgi:hypothetical protein
LAICLVDQGQFEQIEGELITPFLPIALAFDAIIMVFLLLGL